MKYILMFTLLSGCYPADEYLSVPGGKEIRMHCFESCPNHDDLRYGLSKIAEQMAPHIKYDPYETWSRYAITFRDDPMYYKEQRILGITLHNKGAVGIWYPHNCGDHPLGICPGVLGWEMKLVLVERELRRSNEAQKLEWLRSRGIENIDWNIK
jgi:hypothetical protein